MKLNYPFYFMDVCDECNGVGHWGTDCCGAKTNSDCTCTKCGELADYLPCENCNGSGESEFCSSPE